MIDYFTSFRRALTASLIAIAVAAPAVQADEFNNTWRGDNSAIVLDAYEHTPIKWLELPKNKNLAAFINKASDGLAPEYRCKSDKTCRVNWKRYSATKELYRTRRALAITQGLKWGAYHLARPGNPIKQAEHFLSYTKPGPDDLLALDIEHDDPRKWMSLEDGEIFAKHIKMRTGRWPILYTNHYTSRAIAARKHELPILSRLNLWYARYKSDIRGVFPMGNWDSYTIWQFSSMVNCNDKTCPMRIKGTGNWIDVNVAAMSVAELKAKWPFAELTARKPEPAETLLVASANSSEPAAARTVINVTKPARVVSSGGIPVLRSTFEKPVAAPGIVIAGVGYHLAAHSHTYFPPIPGKPSNSPRTDDTDMVEAEVAKPSFRTASAAAAIAAPKTRPKVNRAKPKAAKTKPKYTPEEIAAYKRFLKRQAAIRAARKKKAESAS